MTYMKTADQNNTKNLFRPHRKQVIQTYRILLELFK
jgi:hypothetical protein